MDFDNDGWLDMYHANGAVFRLSRQQRMSDDPYAEPNQVLQGTPDGRFRPVEPTGGTRELLVATSRAAAFGDIDNDGGLDVLVVNRDGPVHLLRNVVPDRGNWIMFRVLNEHGSDALNARVTIVVDTEDGERIKHREVRSAYSYLAANDPRVHFGLGERQQVREVTVHWLGGEVALFGDFQANQVVTLRRGGGTR